MDDATIADFVARHGAPSFEPVTVVIPSYGEAANIEGVLAEIPDEMLGMGTSALVVVDGRHPEETEGATAARVEATGNYVAVAPVNRGQGAALWIGYRLAREGGARYVVSLDADGQYDAAEIPRLLELVHRQQGPQHDAVARPHVPLLPGAAALRRERVRHAARRRAGGRPVSGLSGARGELGAPRA